MKNSFHYLAEETRTETIFRHTRKYIARVRMPAFVIDVVATYYGLIPERNKRVVKFHLGGEHYEDLEANSQLLGRYMNPAINARLPADLEEAWVMALGDPERSNCLRDLAARYGLLAAPIPESTPRSRVQNIASLFRETGEAAAALAPLLDAEPGCPFPITQAACAYSELNDVIACAVNLRARLEERFAAEKVIP